MIHCCRLQVVVRGRPVPQGGMRAFTVKGVARVTHSRPTPLLAWRDAIGAETRRAMGSTPAYEGPVRLDVTFALHRPASAPRAVLAPAKRPDIDKLVRAVLDGLSAIAYHDDGQVVTLNVSKVFAGPELAEGVYLDLYELTNDPLVVT